MSQMSSTIYIVVKNDPRGALRDSGLYLDEYCISKTFTSGQCINITKKQPRH